MDTSEMFWLGSMMRIPSNARASQERGILDVVGKSGTAMIQRLCGVGERQQKSTVRGMRKNKKELLPGFCLLRHTSFR